MDIVNLPDILQQRFRVLPPHAQHIFEAFDYTPTLKYLLTKYHTTVEQIASIEEEFLLVMFGLEDPDALPNNIAREAGVDAATASHIATDINIEVVEKLQNQLDAVVHANPTDATTTPTTPQDTPRNQSSSDRTLDELLLARAYEKNAPTPTSEAPGNNAGAASTPQPTTPPLAPYRGPDPYREEPR